MLSKKRGLVIATVIAFLSFISVTYFSCTKPGNDPRTCSGVYCENGGYCNLGTCICPSGFEGKYCATASVAKYVGTWDLTQEVIGSDSMNDIGKDSSYIVFLKKTATPTTFFVNNFFGNANYNNLVCTIDSANTATFRVDTLTPFHMLYNYVHIYDGAHGDITDNKITMHLRVRHLTETVNWQLDTLLITMKPHKF
ncbi:MAG: calcium-binding EGF-like domain-containing protein [Bacteroidota bacterium]